MRDSNSTKADSEQSIFHTAQHNLLNITSVLGECIKVALQISGVLGHVLHMFLFKHSLVGYENYS
jgi:hypothetical protein